MSERTPWDNTPATKEETEAIHEQLRKDNETPVSEELEKHLKDLVSYSQPTHNYGDEDQNDIMNLIDEHKE